MPWPVGTALVPACCSIQPATKPAAVAMRGVVGSVVVEQKKDRAVFEAVATTEQVRTLASAGGAPGGVR